MAKVIITMKVMPEDPSVDLTTVENQIKNLISKDGGVSTNFEKQPIGFGLVSLIVRFAVDEAKGGTDKIEAEIAKVPGVNSVEVTMVSRAMG